MMEPESTNPESTTTGPAKSVFTSDSFLEKVGILLLTVILSGIFVPLIIKWTDDARAERAAVSRQQERLFEEVSETILTYETLALDVSYFGTPLAANAELQRRAYDRYSERVVDLTAKWRVEASRARSLASKVVSDKIYHMLGDVFDKQDSPTVALWNQCAKASCDLSKWERLHTSNEEMTEKSMELIDELAKDLKLNYH